MRDRRQLLATFLAVLLLATLVACGSPGPPQPPSLELPKPVTDLHATRKGDKITLVWTVPTVTTDLETVRHLGPTLVCRSLQVAMNRCSTAAGQVPPSQLMPVRPDKSKAPLQPVQISFVDNLPRQLQDQHPTQTISYAVATQNTKDRSAGLSNQVEIPLAPTLPAPADLKAKVTADGVVLTWPASSPQEESPGLRHEYRVYRREQGSNKDTVAGEVAFDTSPEYTFTDRSFEWQKNYEYRVCVVTTVSGPAGNSAQVEGDDSPEVGVVAKDVFPPAVPSGLQAVASGVGQRPFIDLTWAPVTDADLDGYNVYRHEQGQAPVKINTELVKTPAFRDEGVQPGTRYFYSVSSVDVRGNESATSEESGESVPTS